MSNEQDSTQIPDGQDDAQPPPVAPPAANPAALSAEQLARLLGLPEGTIRDHLAAGAPGGADGTVNLVRYVAWLIKELANSDGD